MLRMLAVALRYEKCFEMFITHFGIGGVFFELMFKESTDLMVKLEMVRVVRQLFESK